MRIGCAVAPGQLPLVAPVGYDYAELPCRTVHAMAQGEFERLVDCARAGGTVAALNLYCPPEIVIAGPGFDVKRAEAYAREAAERAGRLGTRFVGIGSPKSRTLPDGYDRALASRQAVDFLRATADAFGPVGITVCFEALAPCFCNFVNRLHEAADIVADTGCANVELVVDFYNMELSGEGDEALMSVLPLVAHAHISDDEDNDPTRRSYLHPGKGEIHRRRVQRLRACGYQGALTLEIDVPMDVRRAAESLHILRGV